VHAHDQHFLVIGAVEDADAAALGQFAGGAPQEVVLELRGAGVLEAHHMAALRVDAGHDVLDHAVLAGRVHGLEDDQQRVAVVGVEPRLQVAQAPDMAVELAAIVGLRAVIRRDARRPLPQAQPAAGSDAEIVRVDLHGGRGMLA
jgi:hypothetical protein